MSDFVIFRLKYFNLDVSVLADNLESDTADANHATIAEAPSTESAGEDQDKTDDTSTFISNNANVAPSQTNQKKIY